MTPIYNQYIKPKFQLGEIYKSEFAFVNSAVPIICKKLYYVQFVDYLNKKSGFYLDNNDLFKNLYLDVRKNTNFDNILKKTNNLIINIQPVTNYYSYIKVIKDKQHTELEGQIMIYKFGREISEKITEYLYKNMMFEHSFEIAVRADGVYGYHKYDKCDFSDNKVIIIDKTLDINSEISFKQINLKMIEREEKLKNIKTEIELKNERYEEYLKLKEEFENEK